MAKEKHNGKVRKAKATLENPQSRKMPRRHGVTVAMRGPGVPNRDGALHGTRSGPGVTDRNGADGHGMMGGHGPRTTFHGTRCYRGTFG